ncbi:MAG TPA: outer membrane protein assembly factor BamC [Thiobacillaceae bacterium]|nr:outer membrane protein assembly factor BamC [Thiobacillaceae bacterium]
MGVRVLPLMLAGLFLLSGCGSLGIFESKGVDYKSAKSRDTNTLEVPPDLIAPSGDNRYAVPDTAGSTATYSAYSKERKEQPAEAQAVLPEQDKVRIERAGSQRWLVVNESPDQVWPVIKDFWQELGFVIDLESKDTGVMETDWAENRANIPQDVIRRTIGKVFEGMYSTPVRDKFRTRIEKGANGTTEIYISHRGMEEIYTTEGKDQTKWQPRPSDPDLEAEMLRRLMVRFGVDEAKAKTMLANQTTEERARIVKNGNAASLELDEAFDRAWRRVGLALDRVGFAVEDRDRTKGVYYVRYIDPEIDNAGKKDEGFMSKLAFWKSKKDQTSPQLQIVVAETGDKSHVTVEAEKGKTVDAATQNRIIKLLHNELK